MRVAGRSAFHDTDLTCSGALAYIGGQWVKEVAFAGRSVPLTGDFPAAQMLASVPCDPARRAAVVAALDVDLAWRMHRVSDGQRRRVQLAYGLLRPFDVLLLDEVTVDLDVLGRAELMAFLRRETEVRGATVVYATHIFDGLGGWASHVARLSAGRLALGAAAEVVGDRPLLAVAEGWLREAAAEDAAAGGGEAEGGAGRGGGAAAARNNGWAAGRLASTLSDGAALGKGGGVAEASAAAAQPQQQPQQPRAAAAAAPAAQPAAPWLAAPAGSPQPQPPAPTPVGVPGSPGVQVTDLTFSYPGCAPSLASVSLSLPRGSRCLLLGANGAGKSTLLTLLAGRTMAPPGSVRVLGSQPFECTDLTCTGALSYLGSQARVGGWGGGMPAAV